MASGTVGYTDTRGNKDYLGIVAQQVGRRLKEASNMARSERAYAESVAEKNNTSLDEAGIGRGHFFKRALGSRFGGDRIARTRGRLSKNPGLGRDPTKNYKQRFRGGFDYSYKQDIAEAAAATGGAIVPAMRGVQIGIDSVGSAVVNVGSALDGLARTQQDLAKATMFNGMILQVMVRELQQSRSRLAAAREERSLEAGTRKLLGPGGGIKGLLPGAGGTGGGGGSSTMMRDLLSFATNRSTYKGAGAAQKGVTTAVKTLQAGGVKPAVNAVDTAASITTSGGKLVDVGSSLRSIKGFQAMGRMGSGAVRNLVEGVSSATGASGARVLNSLFRGKVNVNNITKRLGPGAGKGNIVDIAATVVEESADAKTALALAEHRKSLSNAEAFAGLGDDGIKFMTNSPEMLGDLKALDSATDGLASAKTIAAAADAGAKPNILKKLIFGTKPKGLVRGSAFTRMLIKNPAGKMFLKKLPLIGAVAGTIFAAQRLMEGDFLGAGLELGSGLLGAVGAAPLSLGIDGFLLARDFGAVPFAKGGLLTGKRPVNALMGEAGPEIVTPLNDETFIKFGEGILDAQNRNKSKFINLQSAALEKGFDRFADKRNWFQKLFRMGEEPTKPPFVDIDDDGIDDYTGKPEEPTELQKFGNFLLDKGNQAVQGVQGGLNWLGNLFTPKANANTESNTPMLPGPPPPIKTGNKGNFNVYELAFLEMTRQLEGTSGKNSLSTWFGDYGGKTKYGDLTGKTLQEVYDLQTKFLQDPQSQFTDLKGRTLRSAAVGMGQFINPLEQVRAMYAAQGREFDPNKIMFNEQTQMELILDLAKRKRGIDVSKPLTLGGLDILQNEWASFGPGHGQTNRTTGQSLELYNKILRKMMGDMGDTSSLTPTGVDQKVASILNTSMNSSPESGITNIITNNYYTGAGGSDQQADTVFGSDFANLGLEYANINYSLASKA